MLDDNEMKIFEVLKEMPPNTRDKIYTSTDKYDDLMNFLIDKKVVVDKEKGKRYFDIFKVASMEAKTPGMSVRMSKLPF